MVSKSVHCTSMGQLKGAEQLGYGRHLVLVRYPVGVESSNDPCHHCRRVGCRKMWLL